MNTADYNEVAERIRLRYHALDIFIPTNYYMQTSHTHMTLLIRDNEIPVEELSETGLIMNQVNVSSEDWWMHQFYYQFNVVGEVLARMCSFIFHNNHKTIHLKLTPKGLFVWYGSIRKPVDELLLSNNPVTVCKWFGIDYYKIMKGDGIYSPKDIAEIIANSHLFRLTRMPTGKAKYKSNIDFDQYPDAYRTFNSIISLLQHTRKYLLQDDITPEIILDELDDIFKIEASRWHKLLVWNWKLNRMARHKFNGYALWKKTGIGGGPLRQQMYLFRRLRTNFRWAEYIFNNSVDRILEDFDEFSKPVQIRLKEYNDGNNI